MTVKKITLSDVAKKHIKIVGYLLGSGVLGWILAKFVMDNQELTVVFAPAINYIIWIFEKELKNEGVREALK